MKHNPYFFSVGDTVILDKDSAVEQDVIIVKFTPNYLLATVYNAKLAKQQVSPINSWEVMTNRLYPKIGMIL